MMAANAKNIMFLDFSKLCAHSRGQWFDWSESAAWFGTFNYDTNYVRITHPLNNKYTDIINKRAGNTGYFTNQKSHNKKVEVKTRCMEFLSSIDENSNYWPSHGRLVNSERRNWHSFRSRKIYLQRLISRLWIGAHFTDDVVGGWSTGPRYHAAATNVVEDVVKR